MILTTAYTIGSLTILYYILKDKIQALVDVNIIKLLPE